MMTKTDWLRGRRWPFLILIALVAVSGQLAFSTFIPAKATLAGANGLSAALGLANGHGLTIAPSEGIAIKRADPAYDVRGFYAPREDRLPLIEPLPGLVLVYFLIGLTGLPLTLNLLMVVNAILVAVGAMALANELMFRRLSFGVASGLALAGFVPLYRLSMAIGYDVFEFLFALAAVVCLLKFQRTSDRKWLIANAVCLGLGLWFRSYFILYVAAQAIVVGILLFRRGRTLRPMLSWAVPIILLAITMISVRDSGSTGTALTRGGFWHTFWMGVGQFENDTIAGFTDWDVCGLASELGYEPPCDSSYEDPRLPYLYQYRLDYNALLGSHAREWIPDNIPRLARNKVFRLGWMAVPGLMDSSRLETRPAVRYTIVLISLVIFLLALVAVIGVIVFFKSAGEELTILLGTYLALVPLAPYYIIAKVVMVSYFCVLVLACAGGLGLWDWAKHRRGNYFPHLPENGPTT